MEEVYGTFNNNGNGKKMGALQKKSYNILYKHYFSVELYGVLPESGLLNISEVIPYLQQNLPVPFADEFVWGSLIKQKLAQMNIDLAEYNIELETDLEATSVCTTSRTPPPARRWRSRPPRRRCCRCRR